MDLHNQIVNTLKEKYFADESVFAMFVIGSVARGDYSATSDIDLILVTEKEPENSFEETLVNNILVEIKKGTVLQYQLKMKGAPMRIWQFLNAKVLFDKINCYEVLKETANGILVSYEPKNMDAILKWLSSVKIKIASARLDGDNLMMGYQVSNVLWKIVEGLYETNRMPTPASTAAYRQIKTLSKIPNNLARLWQNSVLGDLESRASATLVLIDYIITQNA